MPNRKNHIALVLLLVFSIPLIYQQLHILHHHAQKQAPVVCCISFTGSCTNQLFPDTAERLSFSQEQTASSYCVLCEYRFTLQHMPLVFQAGQHFKTFTAFLFIQPAQVPLQPAESDNPTRAPPSIPFA